MEHKEQTPCEDCCRSGGWGVGFAMEFECLPSRGLHFLALVTVHSEFSHLGSKVELQGEADSPSWVSSPGLGHLILLLGPHHHVSHAVSRRAGVVVPFRVPHEIGLRHLACLIAWWSATAHPFPIHTPLLLEIRLFRIWLDSQASIVNSISIRTSIPQYYCTLVQPLEKRRRGKGKFHSKIRKKIYKGEIQ